MQFWDGLRRQTELSLRYTMSNVSSLLGSEGKPAPKPVVLLVDDVRSTRERVARVLVTGGFDTLEAADGREALRVLANSPKVDAILLDLLMSGMNGWEFRELELRNAHLASIPTLVVTVKALGSTSATPFTSPTRP